MPSLRVRARGSTSVGEVARERSGEVARLRVLDGVIVVGFLGLAFLLGCFPLHDTDFWWHLKTGDWIRQRGEVPTVDPFLFGDQERTWIDLHWGFEVLLSLGYERGGVVLLNLAKCAITTLAVGLLLLGARRRGWPVWALTLAWLPGLLLLGGRMYVRPETLTLLYLAVELAVLAHIRERPRLGFVLPVVQLFWVNSQGLFVFGPIVLGLYLASAAVEPGAFDSARRGWWRTVLTASGLTAAACVLNPYGLMGTFFPLTLLRTMDDEVFSTIGELQSIPEFIAQTGLENPTLRLHLVTMGLGALSFLVPLGWASLVRIKGRGGSVAAERAVKPTRGASKAKKGRSSPAVAATPRTWRPSPFRLGLFLVFSWLSWKATRNSHQFAAVVGALTAWNFGEWASAIRERNRELGRLGSPRASVWRRGLAVMVMLASLGFVGSGAYFRWTGEGRTVGLGEARLWFPHEAVRFAGRAGMPRRFLTFHNGLAGLFVYHNGPDQKLYADARLEVVGPQLFGQYRALGELIARGGRGWQSRLDALGDPGVVVDLLQDGSHPIAANLLADSGYSCVWFDPLAAVFVPRNGRSIAEPVDFRALHYGPGPDRHDERVALARASVRLAKAFLRPGVSPRPDLYRPLILLGLGATHRALQERPDDAEAWRRLGELEVLAWQSSETSTDPTSLAKRVGGPFDPVRDLPIVRATYALGRSDRLGSDDPNVLYTLAKLYEVRGMTEQYAPLFERLASGPAGNAEQVRARDEFRERLPAVRRAMEAEPDTAWRNLGELESAVDRLIAGGRPASAARLLESAYEPRGRSWDVTDRIATLWLRVGEPSKARVAWESAVEVPSPALRDARVALARFVESDFPAARAGYRAALAAEPDLFEAAYELAILEAEAGRTRNRDRECPRRRTLGTRRLGTRRRDRPDLVDRPDLRIARAVGRALTRPLSQPISSRSWRA